MSTEGVSWDDAGRGAAGGWGAQEGGFGAAPGLQEGHPALYPAPAPVPIPAPPNDPGANMRAQGQRGQRKDGKRRENSPAPKPLTCKEKRQRNVVAMKEGFHVMRESVHLFQRGLETLFVGLNRIETVAVDILEDEACFPCEPYSPPRPEQILILVLGTCIPSGIWISREELRGRRELNVSILTIAIFYSFIQNHRYLGSRALPSMSKNTVSLMYC